MHLFELMVSDTELHTVSLYIFHKTQKFRSASTLYFGLGLVKEQQQKNTHTHKKKKDHRTYCLFPVCCSWYLTLLFLFFFCSLSHNNKKKKKGKQQQVVVDAAGETLRLPPCLRILHIGQ